MASLRAAGPVVLLGYATAHASETIRKGRSWRVSFEHAFDRFIDGPLTGGCFGWL